MHEPTPKTQLWVIISLVALLGLSVLFARLPVGPFKPVSGLAIAIIKAVLVAAFFMHLKYRDRRMLVFALAGLAWLSLLFTFTLADYLTRRTESRTEPPGMYRPRTPRTGSLGDSLLHQRAPAACVLRPLCPRVES